MRPFFKQNRRSPISQEAELLKQQAELLKQQAELLKQQAELLKQQAELPMQQLEQTLANIRLEAEDLRKNNHLLRGEIDLMNNSRSMRITAPVRFAVNIVRVCLSQLSRGKRIQEPAVTADSDVLLFWNLELQECQGAAYPTRLFLLSRALESDPHWRTD